MWSPNKKIRIVLVAGARPNFMKIAPLLRQLKKIRRFETLLVHTGQHYDFHMSEIFFQNLDIPRPGIHLNVGPGSPAAQTAKIMTQFEKVLLKENPNLVMVVGDVNSTLACSLVASKMNIKIAHVEAGLRSFDRTMPEEINRVLTDRMSDYLFVSEKSGIKNLKKEGIGSNKIFYVGNVMIDTLLSSKAEVNKSKILQRLLLEPQRYAVMTLHRPSNVDAREGLQRVWRILRAVTAKTPLVFPMHPRTLRMIRAHGMNGKFKELKDLKITGPLGYTDFLKLVIESSFVLTDSGGIQEETTYLKIPCMTMRENTERPATLREGSNALVGSDIKKILTGARQALLGRRKTSGIPKYWDGKAAERIAKILAKEFLKQ